MKKSVTLRAARKRAKLTQEGLAEKSGVSQSAISKLERRGGNPGFDLVVSLAAAVNVDPLMLRFGHSEAVR